MQVDWRSYVVLRRCGLGETDRSRAASVERRLAFISDNGAGRGPRKARTIKAGGPCKSGGLPSPTTCRPERRSGPNKVDQNQKPHSPPGRKEAPAPEKGDPAFQTEKSFCLRLKLTRPKCPRKTVTTTRNKRRRKVKKTSTRNSEPSTIMLDAFV